MVGGERGQCVCVWGWWGGGSGGMSGKPHPEEAHSHHCPVLKTQVYSSEAVLTDTGRLGVWDRRLGQS